MYKRQDIRDIKLNANTKIGRNHNKDYVFRYKNTNADIGGHFVLAPAAVQQHDHPAANLAELGDIDPVSINATMAANDATPFGFSWDQTTLKFVPYNIPRNLEEVLDGIVTGTGTTAGTPNILYYDSNVNKYKMRDLRLYLPHENPSVKLIGIPLDLEITPHTVIMKTGNELKRWINSGKWYCSYGAAGNLSLFWDTQLDILGLKTGDTAATLSMQTASQQMTDTLKTIKKGTLFINCIKLATEGEYDELVDGISIRAGNRVKCGIIIELDEAKELFDISFVGDGIETIGAVRSDNTRYNLDISTIKLKRIIMLSVKYFPGVLSNEDITNLLSI